MSKQEEIIAMLKRLSIEPSDNDWDVGRKLREDEDGHENIRVCDGASKICLVCKDWPFVVKWSTGTYGEAMKEVEVYQKAAEQRLDKFFPKTAFLVRINEVDFVVQEKISFSVREVDHRTHRNFERISHTATDRIVEKIEKEFRKVEGGYHRSLDHTWAKMAIVLYGKNACKSLCKFVIENKINDLHNSNVGYLNGRPIILDFSGYYRNY